LKAIITLEVMTRFWNINLFDIKYSIEFKWSAYKLFNRDMSVDFAIDVVLKVRSVAGWDEWIRSHRCSWNGSSDTMNLPHSKCFPRGSIQIRDVAVDIFPRAYEEQQTSLDLNSFESCRLPGQFSTILVLGDETVWEHRCHWPQIEISTLFNLLCSWKYHCKMSKIWMISLLWANDRWRTPQRSSIDNPSSVMPRSIQNVLPAQWRVQWSGNELSWSMSYWTSLTKEDTRAGSLLNWGRKLGPRWDKFRSKTALGYESSPNSIGEND
jgi:hypothetical protein